MLKKDFWYDLPKELIAQEPADPRDAARLMVLDRKNDKILHSVFHELPHYLEKGDLLVVNNSKVLPARLMGTKVPTGAVCELLLLRQVKGDTWECLTRPGKRMQPGTKVEFGDGSLTAVVDETLPDGNKYVTFTYDTETLYEKLDEFGKMPLPPLHHEAARGSEPVPDRLRQGTGQRRRAHRGPALYPAADGYDPLPRCQHCRGHAACRPGHLPSRE